MRRLALATLLTLASFAAHAEDAVQLELNKVETAENRCRMTFVIENKSGHALESLKLDLALFNTEGAVYRRMLTEMAPIRANKTVVKTYSADGDCAQLGAVLVNEVDACAPGNPNACLDALALTSRVKAVRLYK
jgi:hypothetical protein